ncbi:hypothetical protein GCM10009865_54210 [Aeromicrobium ponti]
MLKEKGILVIELGNRGKDLREQWEESFIRQAAQQVPKKQNLL